ncbi:MAG: riboflavin biosynthesis protein RibF [Gemmatales bacterium]|nr:riboflavin biosynthesis protein RibF [Gemmatales bacterium]MDW8222367.1 riboflavin biosynthesis protein RibF [Gemmatales bacterium]
MATWRLFWHEEVPTHLRGGIWSLGNFDGVHRGHQALLSRVVAHARRLGRPAVALTFDPHPWRFLRPDWNEPPLVTLAERLQRMLACGLDHVVVCQTEPSLLRLEAEQFLEEVLAQRWQVAGLVEGPTFTFGHQRRGNIETLVRWCARRNLLADVVPPVTLDGITVSSTRIRQALLGGDVAAAARMLGRPYAIRGRIGTGEGRGRGLGFPTANLADVATLLPSDGVYAGAVCWRGKSYPAAIHIGANPTFADTLRKIEVFLLGFQGELYGAHLTVHFLARLREVRTFPQPQALQAQIAADVERTQQIFSQWQATPDWPKGSEATALSE